MKKLTEAQILEIISLYNNGMQPKAIGEIFGIFNNSVTRILKKKNIARDKLEKVSNDDIQYIIKEYTNGKSTTIIAASLNICDSTVSRILKRNNIAIRPATINKRKYKINETFFEKIDTEEKAYFLGLLYADGSLSRGGNGIKICLHKKDKDILDKFAIIIYGFIKNYYESFDKSQGEKYVTVPIYSNKMHADLCKLGCHPNKTFTIKFPDDENIVPQNLMHHFLRGYFDGDGCISISKLGKPVIDFTSNIVFISGLEKYLTKNNLKCNKIGINNKNPLTGSVQLTGHDNIINAYNLLYKDATIYFNRKYNIFQDLLKYTVIKNDKYHDFSKYGTTYIPEFNDKSLNSKNISEMSPEEKTDITNYLFDFYRQHGFPYSQLSDDEIIKDFTSLQNTDSNLIFKNVNEDGTENVLTTFNNSGISTFKYFAPHFFDTNCGLSHDRLSMLQTFNNDDLLKKVIRNRLEGDFNMSGNMLKQGLANSKLAYKASIFNPTIAKYIYTKYTKNNDIVYDYSAGFGQRLMAALSINHKLKYIGVDPMQKTIESNQNIYSFLKKNIPLLNKEVELICDGSENYFDINYTEKISLAFSCPPYFNTEIYENNKKQAYFDNKYTSFINYYWNNTAKNIAKMLVPDGIFALNIKEYVKGFNIAKDMINIMREHKFELLKTYNVQIARNTVFGNKRGKLKYEPLFIMRKLK